MEKNKTEDLKEMMVKKDGNKLDVEIDNLVNKRVLEILKMKPEKTKKDIFYMMLDQAKLGMSYKRDREVMKRVSSGHMIQMINVIATDPAEKKAYLEATHPELSLIGGK